VPENRLDVAMRRHLVILKVNFHGQTCDGVA